uniref:Uncharacterized protein n=1 Tax=Oryza meridionalis TaxID=40149 RepID=A0A0E0FAG6_9ORYZ
MDLPVISRSDDSEATAARPIGDTIIPRAYGMISKSGSAQARCIPWPRDNLMHPSGQALHSKLMHPSGQALHSKENIGREDTHSRAKKIGKARPDSLYANFTNSQLLTTSRF